MTASLSPPLNHHETTPIETGTASPFFINKTFSSGLLGVTNPTVTYLRERSKFCWNRHSEEEKSQKGGEEVFQHPLLSHLTMVFLSLTKRIIHHYHPQIAFYPPSPQPFLSPSYYQIEMYRECVFLHDSED
ncbi:hypothetical protein HanPSC8_Chr03g0099701 [Helianthus annuus]|nr:hypothetical protein HanPSC8_Chr03g0099701 [Helianthus annuus]